MCSGCPRPWLHGLQLIRAPAKAVSAPLAPSCPVGRCPARHAHGRPASPAGSAAGRSLRGARWAVLGMPAALLGSRLMSKTSALFESKSHFQMPSFPTKERRGAVTSSSLGTPQRRIVRGGWGIPPCLGHAPAWVFLLSLLKLLLAVCSRCVGQHR